MSFPRPPAGPDDRGIVAAIALLLTATVGLSACSRTEAVQQPINYNHRLHVVDQELECTDCHEHARDLARATIPSMDICAECHDPHGGASTTGGATYRLLRAIPTGSGAGSGVDVAEEGSKTYTVARGDNEYFGENYGGRGQLLAKGCSQCHTPYAAPPGSGPPYSGDAPLPWCPL